MFSTELAFKKIDKNLYVFSPGFIFFNKGYYINEKEKKLLELLILNLYKYIVSLSVSGFMLVRSFPRLGLMVYFLSTLIFYMYYKVSIKKILADRKKERYIRDTYIERQKRIAYSLSLKNISKILLSLIIIILVDIFFINQYVKLHDVSDLIFITILTIITVFLFSNCLLWLYFTKHEKYLE